MIDPAGTCLFIPPELKKFKLDLFERIGSHIEKAGGKIVKGDVEGLRCLVRNEPSIAPIVGCSPQLVPLISQWRRDGRRFIYWDRGYFRRVFATWLPRGQDGGYYRWHLNAFQMRIVRDVPDDRWRALNIEVLPWQRQGDHIVIAAPTRTYARFHGTRDWIADTIDALARVTSRQLVIRDKETKRPLQADLDGAHALVTHGSIAAVEAVVCGCPVFIHADSAAVHVGQTDLSRIEKPVYPDRTAWLNSLAYCQFNESELCDGTLWKLIA